MNNESYFTLVVYSHFFKITDISNKARQLIKQFTYRFVQYGLIRSQGGKFIKGPIKTFGASNANRTEFRFHKNSLKDFIVFLEDNFITTKLYKVVEIPLHESRDTSFDINPTFKLRDYQEPAYDYLINEDDNFKLLEFRMGRGKGSTSIKALHTLHKRTLIVIKSSYVEKWVVELNQFLLLNKKSIMTVSGSSQFKGLIELANTDELLADFIIISNRTYQNFITCYEDDSEFFKSEYSLDTPEELFSLLKIGVRLIDEVHQDFHFNFKLDLYTNVYKTISLSATLLSYDRFLSEIYEIMYPKVKRYNEALIHKFVHSHAVKYNISEKTHIKTSEYNSTTYSHLAFEKSAIKNNWFLTSYFELIDKIAQEGYFNHYAKGDKLIIFASSIDMVTRLTEYFNDKYPVYDVRRYVEDDPYENILDADIRITTVLSGGTAIDIPGLTCSILTIAINSVVSNLQSFGRLRDIPNRDVRFYYFVCNQIPKHLDYHNNKKELMAMYAKTYREINYPKMLGLNNRY